MTNADFKDRLYGLIRTCGINQRYHHRLSWWFGFFDKLTKISIGAVAIAALVATLLGTDWHDVEVQFAIAAAILAIAINVLPFGEREKVYDELFRCWSDLRTDAEVQDVKIREVELQGDNKPVADHFVDRLTELLTKQHTINSKEAAPIRWLLRKCQEDENESVWGRKIRTPDQVTAKRKELESEIAAATSSQVVAAQ